MWIEVEAGPQVYQDGVKGVMRGGRLGDGMVSELQARFYEQNYRGFVFSGGMTATAISNATFTTGTLSASCTPIAGVWNPASNSKNLVVLQAVLSVIITAATNTSGAPYVWATSTGNAAISTGNNPLNRATLAATGSQGKDMSGVALTGLTNNLTVRSAAALGGGAIGNFSFVGTAAGPTTTHAPSVENVDGAWIVPPGGVLALLATTTPVAHSASSTLLWMEVQTA